MALRRGFAVFNEGQMRDLYYLVFRRSVWTVVGSVSTF